MKKGDILYWRTNESAEVVDVDLEEMFDEESGLKGSMTLNYNNKKYVCPLSYYHTALFEQPLVPNYTKFASPQFGVGTFTRFLGENEQILAVMFGKREMVFTLPTCLDDKQIEFYEVLEKARIEKELAEKDNQIAELKKKILLLEQYPDFLKFKENTFLIMSPEGIFPLLNYEILDENVIVTFLQNGYVTSVVYDKNAMELLENKRLFAERYDLNKTRENI